MSVSHRVIDVYPYRRVVSGIEFLLLRRARDRVYAGQWRMVGGKVEEGEAAWQAALRELREETGQHPVQAWAVPSVNAFYEWQHDRLRLIPVFAAELAADPVLDDEHDDFCWLSAAEAVEKLLWPEQQRLVALVASMLDAEIPPELVLPGD